MWDYRQATQYGEYLLHRQSLMLALLYLLVLTSRPVSCQATATEVEGHSPQHLLEYMQLVQAAEASSNATADPLLTSPLFPLYDKLNADNLASSLTTLFKELDESISELEASQFASWQATVNPFERISDRMNVAWGVVDHLQGVKNSDALRALVDQLQPEQIRISQRLSQSSPLYSKFQAIRNASDSWSETQTRVLDNLITSAKLAGAALEVATPEGESRESAQVEATNRFNDINLQLSDLSTNFSNNLLDSTAAFKRLITEKGGVAGLPASFLGQAAQKAQKAGYANASADTGPWLVGLDAPSYTAILSYADNRTMRQEVYTAYETRASSGSTDNSPVVEKIISLRQEQAQLAGYNNAADYLMSNKMATPETAMTLLEQLRNASFATAQKELDSLRQFAAAQGFTQTLMNWDQSYYAQKQQQALFNLTDEDVRPYFAYPTVLAGLHQLTARLFNATIVAADGEVPVWDPSVRFFKVYRDGALKGYLYLDPYARPGEKNGGAWEVTLVSQSALLAAPGQSIRLPVAAIVTNQSPPVGDAPSLMTMDEVVTIFHETGHAMQALLTTQTDVTVSGINGIEQDAIEQPSQFLERWPYEREVAFSIGRHYLTNETLPEELYQKITATRNYRSGTSVLRQLYFAMLDLTLHAQYFPKPGVSVEETQLYRDVVSKSTVMPPIPGDRFLNGFSHIFSGGYAAGYYGYKWAQVMSIDGFAAFQEIGMSATAAIAKEGLRYRDTILSLGGARAPGLVFQDFRGRPPMTLPLLKDEGLVSPNTTTSAESARVFMMD